MVRGPLEYVAHVKGCLSRVIAAWSASAYSTNYFAQVRAMSPYPAPGTKRRRRRNQYRAWGWARVRADGPALSRAEVSVA